MSIPQNTIFDRVLTATFVPPTRAGAEGYFYVLVSNSTFECRASIIVTAEEMISKRRFARAVLGQTGNPYAAYKKHRTPAKIAGFLKSPRPDPETLDSGLRDVAAMNVPALVAFLREGGVQEEGAPLDRWPQGVLKESARSLVLERARDVTRRA